MKMKSRWLFVILMILPLIAFTAFELRNYWPPNQKIRSEATAISLLGKWLNA